MGGGWQRRPWVGGLVWGRGEVLGGQVCVLRLSILGWWC